jgi:hypothetical protein
VLPTDWVLWAAELDEEPSTWQRALAEASARRSWRADRAPGRRPGRGAVSSTRWKFPDLDGEAFLQQAQPTLGLRGGDLQVALTELPALRDALLVDWPRHAPEPLRAGATAVHVDGEGVHMGLVLSPQPEAEDVLLQWMRIEAAPADDADSPPHAQPAVLEALVRLGYDGRAVPGLHAPGRLRRLPGRSAGRARLRPALGPERQRHAGGRRLSTTVRCHLDPSLEGARGGLLSRAAQRAAAAAGRRQGGRAARAHRRRSGAEAGGR